MAAARKTAPDVSAVRHDVEKLRADLASLAQSILDAGKSGAHDARERLEEEARKRLDQVRDAASYARDRAQEGVETIQETIQERPITSVAIAFGLGLLLGKLFDRR